MKRYYAETHEWIYQDGDKCFVGISEYAQDSLGDIVYVDMPSIGQHFPKGGQFAVIESVKTASDIYLPLSGTIVAVNEDVVSSPEIVNENALGNWLVIIKPDNLDFSGLMSEEEYLRKNQ